MSQLRLQIRKDIRDVYEKPDSAVQKAFRNLAAVVGYSVVGNIQWPLLWLELSSVCPDTATFVPCVARVLEVWSDTLARRLEDDRHEAWTEKFLGKIEIAGSIKFDVVVAEMSRVKTSWHEAKHTFMVSMPKSTISLASAPSVFATDFESMFSSVSDGTEQELPAAREEDDWAEIDSHVETRSIRVTVPQFKEQPIKPETLPLLHTLPRPDILFAKLTPYLMHVDSSGPNRITVAGTHEPSLQLLAEYLQRWVKIDPQDVRNVPYLRITLKESKFGLGLFHDVLTIEAFDDRRRDLVVNVVLILGFVQGVLGYQEVHKSPAGGHWELQRAVPFQ